MLELCRRSKPGTGSAEVGCEKGCFWIPFPETGREDAPVHTNVKRPLTEFSPGPKETLGDRNGAVRSRSLAAHFWISGPRAYQNRDGNLAKTCEKLPIIIGFKGRDFSWF